MKSQASRLRAERKQWSKHEMNVRQAIEEANAPAKSDYTDIVALMDDYSVIAEEFEDTLSSKVCDWMSDKLIYVAETIEIKRQEAEAVERTDAEWRALEQEYVMEAQTLEDMELAMVNLLRVGKITRKQVEWCRERMRTCKAWDCDSVFVARDLRQIYCCGQCEREQNEAKRRFKANRTYMPKSYYVNKRSESIEKGRKKYEVSLTDEMAELFEETGSLVAQGKRLEPLIRDQVNAEMKKYEKEGKLFAEKAQDSADISSLLSPKG